MSKRAVKPRINLPLSSSSTAVASTSGGGAAAPSPTTVSMATGNTVVGGLHTHELDIAAHTGDGSAHHNPVTVGNTGLSLSTQQLSLNLAATSGLQIDAGLKIADTIAGNGLTISGKVLAVGEGAGLTVSADAIALTTPGTLTVATSNAASGNHTHAVTSSSNPGATASILASDPSGYLQLRRIGLGTAPSYPLHVSAATQQARFDYNTSNYLSVTVGSDGSTRLDTATGASGGNLTLAPVGDVVLDPTNRYILPGSGYSEHLGMLTRKYLTLHAAELWVETLVAHNTIATIGGRILVGPTTELVQDLPASGTGASTLHVKHNEMAQGDIVYLEAGGHVEFIQVASAPTEVDSEHYYYSVLRDLDSSGASAWTAGDAVFNTGTTGDGFIDLYSVASVKGGLQAGPTIVGNVRTSSTYNAWAEHWAIGNLSGLYGYGATAYGFAAGKYADGQSFVTVDATNGVRMLSRSGGVDTTRAQWAVDGTITIGQVAAERSNIQISAGALSIRNNTTERIGLTAAGVLTIKDSSGAAVITLDASAGAEITKKLTMPGANSAIAIGATPPTSASAGTGLWMDRTGLYGLASNVMQAKMDAATGAIVAGGGLTWLDATGINLRSDGTYIGGGWTPTDGSRISWLWPVTGTRQVGRVDVSTNTALGLSTMELWAGYDASNYASIHITGGNAATGRVTINGRLDVGANTELGRAISALADDASSNLASGGGTSGIYVIACTSEVNICIAGYSNTSGAYIVSDPGNVFRVTDTDGYHCLLVSGSDLQIRNRRGGARNYRVHRLY
jgi:hypothetical protein